MHGGAVLRGLPCAGLLCGSEALGLSRDPFPKKAPGLARRGRGLWGLTELQELQAGSAAAGGLVCLLRLEQGIAGAAEVAVAVGVVDARAGRPELVQALPGSRIGSL